jgi:hypothetical protein
MRKALCAVSLLAIVTAASATVEIRIWTTNALPDKASSGPINFRISPTVYGPFTPFTVKDNGVPGTPQLYDVHRNHVSSSNPGSVLRYQPTAPIKEKFDPMQLPNVVEPVINTLVDPAKDVFIWAAFSGPGFGENELGDPVQLAPIKPLLGWENKGARVQGMHLALVTTGTLNVSPHWYQYENGSTSTTIDQTRWADTSDMTGPEVTLVGLGTGTPASTGWYAGATDERMQTWDLDTNLDTSGFALGNYGAGGVLLGAIKYNSGLGDLYVGVGRNGISTTGDAQDDPARYFAGSEGGQGIAAGNLPVGSPLRVGATPEASWIIPEPASVLLIALGALALRRR